MEPCSSPGRGPLKWPMRSSRSEFLAVPERVFVYEDPPSQTIDFGDLASYLHEETGLPVDLRPEFLAYHGREDLESLSRRIAETKVKDIYHLEQEFPPLLGELDVELRLLRDPHKRLPGILYDGYRFLEVLRSLLPPGERNLRTLHLAFTSRLLSTFDPGDRVHHARVLVCGYPCAVSTSGLVEGPAKPKEFYLARRGYGTLGLAPPTEALKEEIAGRFIDYDDERMTEVLKGYLLQALFYHVTGDPFCEDRNCRLYNAHWQEEMIHAQLVSGRLCEDHQKLLDDLSHP